MLRLWSAGLSNYSLYAVHATPQAPCSVLLHRLSCLASATTQPHANGENLKPTYGTRLSIFCATSIYESPSGTSAASSPTGLSSFLAVLSGFGQDAILTVQGHKICSGVHSIYTSNTNREAGSSSSQSSESRTPSAAMKVNDTVGPGRGTCH